MAIERHYRALEKMYLAAPINRVYKPRISVAPGAAQIEIEVEETFFHAAKAVHGSVYFKMLDDAAFFAASSLVTDYFVLTVAFTTYLTRPIASGIMRSEGRVVSQTRSHIVAEAVVRDGQGQELGRGSGLFVRGKIPLADALGYPDESPHT